MKIKKDLRAYFAFSSRERGAVIALAALIFFALIFPYCNKLFKKHPEQGADFMQLKSMLDTVPVAVYKKDTAYQKTTAINNAETDIRLFPFDPNTISKQQWINFGIAENTASIIEKYTGKGGHFYSKEDLLKIYGFTQDDLDKLAPYIEIKKDEKTDTIRHYKTQINALDTIQLQPFDPNLISKEEWVAMGIPEKTADIILKYRQKGGYFKTKDDLLKIYGFKQTDLDRLSGFIAIKNKISGNNSDTATHAQTKNTIPENLHVEINSATVSDIMQLGFSSQSALRIIQYKDGLGGLYDPAQLKSMRHIDPDSLSAALPHLVADAEKIQKISINSADLEQLKKQSYISEQLAEAIIDYRNTFGDFTTISEIQKVKGMYPWLYEKLKPYLTL